MGLRLARPEIAERGDSRLRIVDDTVSADNARRLTGPGRVPLAAAYPRAADAGDHRAVLRPRAYLPLHHRPEPRSGARRVRDLEPDLSRRRAHRPARSRCARRHVHERMDAAPG